MGDVLIGGDAPIVVQSMTNTDTADAAATAEQVKELARAGSELVRITVNTPEAAARCRTSASGSTRMGVDVPLVGDFHYNGHKLLTQFPDCAEALAKYRINPGNVGKGAKRDQQFAHDDRVRAALRQAGAHRRQLGQPRPGAAGAHDGRERAALGAAGRRRGDARGASIALGARVGAPGARSSGLAAERIVLSCKVSRRAGPDRRLPRACARAATTRCTWA